MRWAMTELLGGHFGVMLGAQAPGVRMLVAVWPTRPRRRSDTTTHHGTGSSTDTLDLDDATITLGMLPCRLLEVERDDVHVGSEMLKLAR